MAVNLSPVGGVAAQFFTNTGAVLTGGKLYTYLAGTTTPTPTYTTSAGNVARTNPIVLDAAGRVPGSGEIWITVGITYKFVLTDSNDVLIGTYDNVTSSFITDASLVSYTPAGTGAVTTTVQAKLRQTVSVQDFGAVGNGVVNDTAALIAAEAAAYAAGVVLYLPAGTYNFNGAWTVRVNLNGYSATIKQTATTGSANVTGTVIAGASNISIQGLSVNGNLYRTGFAGVTVNNVTLRDCLATECLNAGFYFSECDGVLIDRCKATDIRYLSGNTHADGYYFGSCTRSTWRDCTANNFRRIGFVCEGDASVKNEQVVALRCIAYNANNCDDSVGEFNAAFWTENTNSADWVDCVGYDLAGNAGQTSGRVKGMVAQAVGSNAPGVVNVTRCRIYGTDGYLPVGIDASGTSAFTVVNITDCYVDKARSGVSSLCNLEALNITRLTLNDIVHTGASNGGILIDATGGSSLKKLTIDSVTQKNCTFNADSGLVNFFSAPSDCQYTIQNCINVTHVMRSSVATVTADNCEIKAGAATYGSFLAALIQITNSDITSRNGVSTDLIVSTSSLAAQSEFRISDCEIAGFSGGWIHPFGGSDIYIFCDNAKFQAFCFSMGIDGDFQTTFRNCNVYQVPATYGFVYASLSTPTSHILVVQSCYFQSLNAANTPLRKASVNPTASIIQNNVYRGATLLYNFDGGVTQANNVSI